MSSKSASLSATDLLGPEGPLARGLERYENRPGQLRMAEAIERALADERILLTEAGTGTGKTLAYLVPAILSGKKVVVSTATRALQEQIFFKDLPLVRSVLGLSVEATLMKGLGNYLCRRRWEELVRSEEALRPGLARSIETVRSWIEATETGDLGELASLREDDAVRLGAASSSETRLGPVCQHFDACFVTRMRREAERAQIVVVNHHLFFADLALRGPHPGRVLPDYDAVIFDEAHQLEDIATDFFGIRVSESRLGRALDDAERALRHAGALDTLLTRRPNVAVDAARAAVKGLFSELGREVQPGEPRSTLERDVWAGRAERAWIELDGALERVELAARTARDEGAAARASGRQRGAFAGDALEATERRMSQLREQLAAIVDGGTGRVTWLELGSRGGALSSSPVDLSFLLRQRVFETVPAVVLTSATLATRGSTPPPPPVSEEEPDPEAPRPAPPSAFGYVRSRLGLTGDALAVEELVVESPFDFPSQALLYTPRDLPAPASAEFTARAAARVAELIGIVGGGCFVLTTSLRSMRAFHAELVRRLPKHRLLLQGNAPKATLLGTFRAAGDAVLVATQSFWEGVDVPGRSLRLVVLEKVPFAVPTDPVVRARSAVLEAEGKSSFMELHVPAAAIALKQGFGRLIRTATDSGIVALLDERVHRKGYGKRLLEALPPATRTDDLGAVAQFWSKQESATLASRAPPLPF
ncbi:MAG TPA: ATP-dependent DNA helicase [Polyangiaceae bacterium]|nr:ATP-dependent DNA helicase [Polyangiaceae bacterium]